MTLAGCATTAAPVSKPQPAAAPASLTTAPETPVPPQANDDWNIFPDPTTGEVSVFHKGKYVGVITGNEPGDPPMPHKPGKNPPQPPEVNP